MAERAYHLYMELMASESSALLVLSMQHESTQMYSNPYRDASLAASVTLRKPDFWRTLWLAALLLLLSGSSHTTCNSCSVIS